MKNKVKLEDSKKIEKKIFDRYYKSLGKLMQLGIANAKSTTELRDIANQLLDYGKHCPKIKQKYEKAVSHLTTYIFENQ